MGDYIDEANDTFEDTSEYADKDETMSSVQSEEVSTKSVRSRELEVSEPKVSLRSKKRMTPEQIQEYNAKIIAENKAREERFFKSDRLRIDHDLRNKDPKSINNIYVRWHVEELKRETDKLNEGKGKIDFNSPHLTKKLKEEFSDEDKEKLV
jgi:hypothetical protein